MRIHTHPKYAVIPIHQMQLCIMILNYKTYNSLLNLWMLSLKNGKDPNLFHKGIFVLKEWRQDKSTVGARAILHACVCWNCALLSQWPF